ncbi:hypothetical protein WG855_003777 [Escherichia coli]|nr:hypothetical protein [Escherichia coli]EET8268906.1 hypothetical protein [Escherichia coli]EFA1526566.1 hypothetical protein [Escherichia coli]EFS9508332.1 hypothetical protein [Escherichia coli]EGN3042388.1 hypothetical protein [Escherichia coli]
MMTRLVCLDFETFYDKDYSLSKMTTAAYIRSPLFQVICMTATVDDGPVLEAWGYDDVRQLLLSLELDRSDTTTVAHNARFDGAIIEWIFGIRINRLLCTILMMRQVGLSRLIRESLASVSDFLRQRGYPIPAKGHEVERAMGQRLEQMTPEFRAAYGAYCRNDTVILRAVAQLLMPECPDDALRAMDMTLTMYTRPVFVLDKPLLEKYLVTLREKRQAALQEMARQYGFLTTDDLLNSLRSKPKLAELLKGLGVAPPMKLSEKKTETAKAKALVQLDILRNPEASEKEQKKAWKTLAGLGIQSDTPDGVAAEIPELEVYDYAFAKTDLEFKQLADHPDPRVAALVTARMENNTSIAESRTLSLLNVQNPMPVPLQYAKAHTSRYTADEGINVQNMPKRQGDKTLRHSITAPEGMEIGAADSSQVEARLLAYAAQEHSLLSIFQTKGDPYSHMAADIYRVPEDDIKYWTKGEGAAEHEAHFSDPSHPSHAQAKRHTFMRNVGKETILGSGYQMSGAKFGLRLRQQGVRLRPEPEQMMEWIRKMQASGKWPSEPGEQDVLMREYLQAFHDAEARRINWLYRSKHQRIKGFWETCEWVLSRMVAGEQGHFGGPDGMLFYFDGQHKVFGEHAPGVMLPDGYWIVYPGLRSFVEEETGFTKYTWKRMKDGRMVDDFIYGGSMTENLIQGLAFAALKWQAVKVHQVVPVKMNVHDEWASVYPVALRDGVKRVYEMAMRAAPPWLKGMPFDCEFKCGPDYGRC